MNLLETLRKSRHAPAVPEERRTRPVSKWTGFKPISANLPAIKPPSPALPNRHERRKVAKFARSDRGAFARTIERYNRETRSVGKSGRRNQGTLKASGVEILKALAFDWWNAKTGRLDPSHETIAEETGWSVSTVRRVLAAAQRVGILHWIRRPAFFVGGRWKRQTNSYHFGVGTTLSKLRYGFEGCKVGTVVVCETLRNVAQSVGCKFLS